MAYLEQLPEEKLRVNGFKRIKGHESYIEWRRVGGGRVVSVWASFGERGPSVWDVLYTVKTRNGGIVDQGEIAEISAGSGSAKRAVNEAVAWMRSYDNSGTDPEFDIGGGL